MSLPRTRVLLPLTIVGAVALILGLGGAMFVRAGSHTNKVALDAAPKGVTVVEARLARYRPTVRYIGTIEPWVEARLGPQYTSAYVDMVLVRPGATVTRGQVLATLDCRNASAASKAVSMRTRALEAQQVAIAHEAARVGGLLHGGYVSQNEVEQKTAESASKQAELLSARAKLLRASLEVNDCIMRAPFAGEVADRMMDPGAFARPGSSVVSVVDRSMVRVTADVPEVDFAAVAPGTPVKIHVLAIGEDLVAKIARRSPAADPSTRTVHFEIDLPDALRRIPVHTSADLSIEVGKPVPATEIPLIAAAVRGSRASVFVVDSGVAHKVAVPLRGENAGSLFVAPTLRPGSLVVTEGRTLLKSGDRVSAARAAAPTTVGARP